MYRTYKLNGNEKYHFMTWDGDTYYYSVFESKEEMEKEQERIKKIDEDIKKAYEAYLNSLKD